MPIGIKMEADHVLRMRRPNKLLFENTNSNFISPKYPNESKPRTWSVDWLDCTDVDQWAIGGIGKQQSKWTGYLTNKLVNSCTTDPCFDKQVKRISFIC